MSEDAEGGTGVATVADRPAAKADATTADSTAVVPPPETEVDRTKHDKPMRAPAPVTVVERAPTGTDVAHLTLTTAAEALHDEEIERTRWFIAIGWACSLAAVAVVPFLPSPRYMQIALVAGMLGGIAFSYPFFRRFKDPRQYTERALFKLALFTMINAHTAILYFGPFTMCPVIVVVGLHFPAAPSWSRRASASR
jgi:hypothetical protein